jgi:hypothetical protein
MGGDIHIERDTYNIVINVLKPKLTMHICISSIKGSIQPKNKWAHYCLGILHFKMYDQPNDYQKDPYTLHLPPTKTRVSQFQFQKAKLIPKVQQIIHSFYY